MQTETVYNDGMKYLECIINSGLFRNIDKSGYIDAFEKIEIIERSYFRGETIFYENDLIDWVCIVHSGSVRAEKNYPNGDIHIVSIFEENAIFGLEIVLSQRRTTPVDYIANENCRILFLSLKSLYGSRYTEAFRTVLTEKLADENIRMGHKIEILAERGLRDRVLIYLSILAGKSGSNVVTVRMSREQMAQYLCVNRSALSNELNKMKREGLIDFKRHQFRLLDCYAESRSLNTYDHKKAGQPND